VALERLAWLNAKSTSAASVKLSSVALCVLRTELSREETGMVRQAPG